MRTDIHTHVFHSGVAAKVMVRLQNMGFTPAGTGVIADLLPRAKAAGIERVVCHTAALTGDQVRPANNFAIALASRPKDSPDEPEVVSFGAIHPDCPTWPGELDRLEAAGIMGIKLHPNFQNLAFDDPRLFPVMEAIGARFILMCHVGCENPLTANPASPYKLAGLVAMFPKARVIAAHLGGYADGAAALDALAGKKIWLDTSNTGGMDRRQAKAILAMHPRERVLFGSDYPLFDSAGDVVRQQWRFSFSDAEMDRILHNADELLG